MAYGPLLRREGRRIVRALESNRKQAIYPRGMGLVYQFAGLNRVYSGGLVRRLAPHIDTADPRVVLAGSQGDPEARRARKAWEAGQTA